MAEKIKVIPKKVKETNTVCYDVNKGGVILHFLLFSNTLLWIRNNYKLQNISKFAQAAKFLLIQPFEKSFLLLFQFSKRKLGIKICC